MVQKREEKEKAILLRSKGYSYSEILNEVHVAKSTLSIWLRDVGLSNTQRQKLTKKKLEACRRGGEIKRKQRIERTELIQHAAKIEVGRISKRELLLIGTALHWAEGAKEKEKRPGCRVDFCNTDPRMIRVYLRWLVEVCEVKRKDIQFSIYIHKNMKDKITDVKKYWLDYIKFSERSLNIFTLKNIIQRQIELT